MQTVHIDTVELQQFVPSSVHVHNLHPGANLYPGANLHPSANCTLLRRVHIPINRDHTYLYLI